MILKKYTGSQEVNNGLFLDMKEELDNVLVSGRTPKVLLSGGSSPKVLYKMLGNEFTKRNSLKIGLVDERFVPTSHDQSNELMIRSCFSDDIEIVGMVKDDQDYENNLLLIQDDYLDFHQELDIVLLGMGPDGHFASIFPSDSASDAAIDNERMNIMNTNAPNFPTRRITCNLQLLAGAKSIYLLIFGKDKFDLLNDTTHSLPIKHILNKRPDIKIYYSDDK